MLAWFQTVAELCWGERGWMEAAELLVACGTSLEPEGDCVQHLQVRNLCLSVFCVHPCPPPLSPLCVKRLGVEDAAHQKGLLFHRGKTSSDNSQSGDAFIACLESSWTTSEMKKAYSFSA